jgi:hypothetical protein
MAAAGIGEGSGVVAKKSWQRRKMKMAKMKNEMAKTKNNVGIEKMKAKNNWRKASGISAK